MCDVKIEQAPLELCADLHHRIPEMLATLSANDYRQKIEDRPFLAQVALVDGRAVGFKLGYAKSEHSFYSWLGGVMPKYRGKGIARKLLLAQEKWAASQGYKEIRVKSMLRFAGMLAMLESQGYRWLTPPQEITLESKIHFAKSITCL